MGLSSSSRGGGAAARAGTTCTERAGLEALLDFILTLDSTRLNEENDQLKELLKASVERPVPMEVYSTKTMTLRQLRWCPAAPGGGQGLLGASVRFCSYQGANENVTPEAPPPEETLPPATVTHGYTEAPLMAAPGQSEDPGGQGLFQGDPAPPPPLRRVMDPEELDDCDQMEDDAQEELGSLAVVDLTSTSAPPDSPPATDTLNTTAATRPPPSSPPATSPSPVVSPEPLPSLDSPPPPLSSSSSSSPPPQVDLLPHRTLLLHEAAEDYLPPWDAEGEGAEPDLVASTEQTAEGTPGQQRWDQEEP
ncbi:hypothetical protein CRUP_015873 [Coryphaenoides rupestris]|nr:hypothetical protein CRUP_015873 [Coryphaenoides rupestris]